MRIPMLLVTDRDFCVQAIKVHRQEWEVFRKKSENFFIIPKCLVQISANIRSRPSIFVLRFIQVFLWHGGIQTQIKVSSYTEQLNTKEDIHFRWQ